MSTPPAARPQLLPAPLSTLLAELDQLAREHPDLHSDELDQLAEQHGLGLVRLVDGLGAIPERDVRAVDRYRQRGLPTLAIMLRTQLTHDEITAIARELDKEPT